MGDQFSGSVILFFFRRPVLSHELQSPIRRVQGLGSRVGGGVQVLWRRVLRAFTWKAEGVWFGACESGFHHRATLRTLSM